MPEPMTEYSKLKSVSTDQETESNGGPAVAFQKYFQEAKANEDHNINILEHRIVDLDLSHGSSFVGRVIKDLLLADEGFWLHTDFVLCHKGVEYYQGHLTK